MKRKTIALSKKLILNKETIAPLDKNNLKAIAGGATVPDNGCVGSNHCDIRFTREAACKLTDVDFCCQLTLYCIPETTNCM